VSRSHDSRHHRTQCEHPESGERLVESRPDAPFCSLVALGTSVILLGLFGASAAGTQSGGPFGM
jgi:hypothetical protein